MAETSSPQSRGGGSPRQAGRDRVTRKGGPLPALPGSPTLPVSLVARRTRNDVSCALCHPNNNNRGVNSSWASLTTHRASWCGLGRWTGKHCLRSQSPGSLRKCSIPGLAPKTLTPGLGWGPGIRSLTRSPKRGPRMKVAQGPLFEEAEVQGGSRACSKL